MTIIIKKNTLLNFEFLDIFLYFYLILCVAKMWQNPFHALFFDVELLLYGQRRARDFNAGEAQV